MEEDNIIQFKNKNKITESEINGLFLGLVKLIKRLAMEETISKLSPKDRTMFEEMQEIERKLVVKEIENDKIKQENAELKQKIRVKNLKILQLSCLKAKSGCVQKG